MLSKNKKHQNLLLTRTFFLVLTISVVFITFLLYRSYTSLTFHFTLIKPEAPFQTVPLGDTNFEITKVENLKPWEYSFFITHKSNPNMKEPILSTSRFGWDIFIYNGKTYLITKAQSGGSIEGYNYSVYELENDTVTHKEYDRSDIDVPACGDPKLKDNYLYFFYSDEWCFYPLASDRTEWKIFLD